MCIIRSDARYHLATWFKRNKVTQLKGPAWSVLMQCMVECGQREYVTVEYLAPNWDILITSPPRLREQCRRRCGKIVTAKIREAWSKELSSAHGQTIALTNSRWLRLSAYDVHGIKPNHISGWTGMDLTRPLTELLSVDGYWGKERQFYLRVWYLVSLSHFSGCLHTHEDMKLSKNT